MADKLQQNIKCHYFEQNVWFLKSQRHCTSPLTSVNESCCATLTNQDSNLTNGHSQSEGANWLPAFRLGPERLQEGDDPVLGDGLEEPRSTCQGLEASADGGEEGTDLHHFRVRPGNVAYH